MPEAVTTEPQGPSLDAASSRIDGLLSVKEDKQTPTAQPEPTPESAEEPKLAEAAPEEESPESESPSAEEVEEPEAEPQQPQKHKVKVDGIDAEVTLEELLKSYSFTAHNTRTAQQLAEQKKQFEQNELAAVRAERQQYATYLDQFAAALKGLAPEEPNWEVLKAQVTPEVFAAELLHWQQTQKKIAGIEAERTRVKTEQDADAQAGFAKYVQAEQAKLEDALPELKEPEKAKVLRASLREFALGRGFTEDDLKSVTDHRMVLLLHDAMQLKAEKAKAPKIENKIKAAMETAKPGSRTPAPAKDALKDAKERLRKSGSVDDGAAAIRHLLG